MKAIPNILDEYKYILKNQRQTAKIISNAQEFRRLYIDPVAFEMDQQGLIDTHHFSQEIMKRGCEYGFLSLPVPSFVGGGGSSVLQGAILLEELSAGCAGISNIFGAHYLGLLPILLAADLNLVDRFLYELVQKEKDGEAVLFAAAITEPMAGTDVEEAEFLAKARLITSAKKVSGGYSLNGQKVFISNGSEAKYVSVICAIDKLRPVDSWSVFVVPANSEGYSVGRVESKMGQRSSHAAELIFKDCFIPEKNRIGVEGMAVRGTEIVLAASRAPVAAIATGIARGAYEKTLQYVSQKKTRSGKLIERQWVQLALAEMYAMIVASRHHYVHSSIYFDEHIMASIYANKAILGPSLKFTGSLRRSTYGLRFTSRNTFKTKLAHDNDRRIDDIEKTRSLGASSLAKFSCSDMAVKVCLKGMEIMGNEGAEERNLVEKYLRDAKLTQIYEGTNQLNRHTVFQHLIGGVVSE